jgi:protein-tyrosine phosphatase
VGGPALPRGSGRLPAVERRVDVEGCHNFRDLGGYPTADGRALRWRVLFRSDALHHLTSAGVATLRDELRIGDVLDLRSSGEVAVGGPGPLSAEPVRIHHLPLFDGEVAGPRERAAELTLGDRYFLLAQFAKQPIAAVIDTLASADSAAVFHCAAGKDRTGVISAILLGLLGVRDEVIVADYAATQENLDAIIERLNATEGYQEMFELLPPDTLHAEPETMLSLLGNLRERYGGMREYVREIGVADEQVSRLRARLLED